ncbi:MAG: EfeM/EfeO family lipoprotein [Methylacidiphilales bacterium]|nr:EfeM/EfeO family lipoprotein [Candidatus Methylacidiphilales bacterium]MDW8348909.1 EfeM/EfeO family lipoprotein [Verrucomicrobiae bacterium]
MNNQTLHYFSRRSFLQGLTAVSVLFLANSRAQDEPGSFSVTKGDDTADKYAQQVDEGLKYFKRRALDQIELVKKMGEAIQSGDISRAKESYIIARPPYEEIEVLANSFPETDAEIDARAYAFENGPTDEAFIGFHKIEYFLFAEENLKEAERYVPRLLESCKMLVKVLDERSRFSSKRTFDGIISVANEVAAKKISSEEETFSDQTLLIFKHNWIGIHSQYKPFHPLVRDKDKAVADEVIQAHNEAMEIIKPHFHEGSVAGTPYSKFGIKDRARVVRASVAIRESLKKAAEVLGIHSYPYSNFNA